MRSCARNQGTAACSVLRHGAVPADSGAGRTALCANVSETLPFHPPPGVARYYFKKLDNLGVKVTVEAAA